VWFRGAEVPLAFSRATGKNSHTTS
jgi:hypothetical protein